MGIAVDIASAHERAASGATSAGGVAEGSQGQAAQRAAPGSSHPKTQTRPERAAASITRNAAGRIQSRYSFSIFRDSGLARFFTPFQGRAVFLT
ncbi:hypothetical protein BH18ACI4_BH18ACI4_01050 [soil metagenome]